MRSVHHFWGVEVGKIKGPVPLGQSTLCFPQNLLKLTRSVAA
jgi:hypothetical protein